MANEDLQELIESIDMQSWMDREGVEYRVTRGSRGTQLNVRECPCCGNSKWKVYINQDSGLGNCFSGDCEEKFNKWKFISKSLGSLTTRQVIEHVRQVASEQGWRPKRQAMATNVNVGELKLPASYAIPIQGHNLKYLADRGIDIETAQYFGLRFSKRGVFKYRDEEGRARVQDYANRVIIPVFDLKGNLASFQGRDITKTAERKYLFPPGFASTGSILYNGHNAHGAESIVIGEGAFDVAAIKIAFDEDRQMRDIVPIGTFGKHLSHGDENTQLARLMELKAEGLKVVTFMWDGEDKAIDAALDMGLLLRRYGFVSRLAILPKDKDPNEVPARVVRESYWKALAINEATAVRVRMSRRAA